MTTDSKGPTRLPAGRQISPMSSGVSGKRGAALLIHQHLVCVSGVCAAQIIPVHPKGPAQQGCLLLIGEMTSSLISDWLGTQWDGFIMGMIVLQR